ncbi:MAG: hypothetical protein IPJ32_11455 [Sphingobacteriaceae bacterium]|nr:hypothetical protein [Sphingobacteriaceae bacterium]
MKNKISKYFFIIFIGFSIISFAQKPPEPKAPTKGAEQNKKAIRKAEKKEAKERRKLEKAEQKAIKAYHKRLQTKTVRKRMKKSRKRAIMNNTNKREPWIKRVFKKKKKV